MEPEAIRQVIRIGRGKMLPVPLGEPPVEGKPVTDRLRYAPTEEAAGLFTPEFAAFLTFLHDRFTPRLHALREARAAVLQRALHEGRLPSHPVPGALASGDWQVPRVPDELKRPGIEISGPASVTGMFINALNPGPDGTRAEGDLDDDEDSAGHRLEDTVRAAWNRKRAIERTLTYYDPERGKEYRIAPGELPFFMHRERGLYLDEPDVTVDGEPVPASILGTALTLFHAGRAHAERGQGIYFYLPKLETAEEAAFWRAFFDACRERLPFLRGATIRAIALVESLPAAYQMEEILHELGPYAAGLNAARWDFQASILEFVMNDPASVWPDRFGVDIKATPFLANIFRRLVAICLKHGAVPIGGMATALPSREEEVNRAAAAAIRTDKEWEARQGFLRGWVAHIFHMTAAAAPFKELRASGWSPSPEMANPDNYPVQIEVPAGPITVPGTRRNARMLLEYLEGWLRGRGAKGIDSLAGQPGIHPALMEDLATARISVAQIAQRVRHGAADSQTGQEHSPALAKRLLHEELQSILEQQAGNAATPTDPEAAERYRKSFKIALRWIRNYTELDFRSLGSYTRADLERVAAAEDAF
jgi:malate synthase